MAVLAESNAFDLLAKGLGHDSGRRLSRSATARSVLRYLPTHLPAPEIARELWVSTSTVKTHMRHLYAKLGAHSRAEAVERARALGMLAPSARSPAPA